MKNFDRIEDLTEQDLFDIDVFNNALNYTRTYDEMKHLLEYAPIDYLEPHMFELVESDLVSIKDIPSYFLDNPEIALEYVKKSANNINRLPDYYKDDESFIYEACHYHGTILAHASERVRNIEKVIVAALNNTDKAFKYVPDFYKTKENCLKVLDYNYDTSYNWKHIPPKLSRSISFIKEAGYLYPSIFQYIDKDIAEKKDITMFFLNRYSQNLKHAADQYKNDLSLVKPLVDKNVNLFMYVGNELKNNVDFVLSVLTINSKLIYECGEKIKENKEIAKYVCSTESQGIPIIFFNEDIKNDKEVAMISLLKTPESMNYLSKELKENKEFVLSYIEKAEFNPIALKFISIKLKRDPEVMLEAYKRNTDSILYIDSNIKYEDDFLNYISSKKQSGMAVSKIILLANLKELSFDVGDEELLKIFCKNAEFDIDDYLTKNNVLMCLKPKLKEILNPLPMPSKYLDSFMLVKKFNKELSQKTDAIKKLKI